MVLHCVVHGVKFSDLSGALRIVGGMAVGVFAYSQFGPQPEPQYRTVEVSVPQIVEVERVDTIVTWKERIVYKTVEAEQVATAPGGAVPDVQSFCADAVREAVASVDSLQGATLPPKLPPKLLLRSVRHDDGWFFARDRLLLTGPLSTSDLRQLTYNVRDGFQVHVMADSVLVQVPRAALLKQIAEAAVWMGAGFIAGSVLR